MQSCLLEETSTLHSSRHASLGPLDLLHAGEGGGRCHAVVGPGGDLRSRALMGDDDVDADGAAGGDSRERQCVVLPGCEPGGTDDWNAVDRCGCGEDASRRRNSQESVETLQAVAVADSAEVDDRRRGADDLVRDGLVLRGEALALLDEAVAEIENILVMQSQREGGT